MKRPLETVLIGLIVAVFSLVVLLFLSRFTGLVNVFVAWATLMLAFAAFMTIQHSNEQERLKEIMDWVDGVLKYCAVYSQDVRYHTHYEFLSEVTGLKLKTDYIASIAEDFGKELSEPLGRATDIFARIYNKLGGEEEEGKKLEGYCIEVKKVISLLRSK